MNKGRAKRSEHIDERNESFFLSVRAVYTAMHMQSQCDVCVEEQKKERINKKHRASESGEHGGESGK